MVLCTAVDTEAEVYTLEAAIPLLELSSIVAVVPQHVMHYDVEAVQKTAVLSPPTAAQFHLLKYYYRDCHGWYNIMLWSVLTDYLMFH